MVAQPVRPPPAVLAFHMETGLSPAAMLLIQLLFNGLGSSGGLPKSSGPCIHVGGQEETPVPKQPDFDCCDPLRSESAGRRFVSSLYNSVLPIIFK